METSEAVQAVLVGDLPPQEIEVKGHTYRARKNNAALELRVMDIVWPHFIAAHPEAEEMESEKAKAALFGKWYDGVYADGLESDEALAVAADLAFAPMRGAPKMSHILLNERGLTPQEMTIIMGHLNFFAMSLNANAPARSGTPRNSPSGVRQSKHSGGRGAGLSRIPTRKQSQTKSRRAT